MMHGQKNIKLGTFRSY